MNASPDLRQQIEANPCLQPFEGIRSTPVAGVVLTNADVDAIAGLLNLREMTPIAIYGSAEILATLDRNPIFEVLDRSIVPRRELRAGAWQSLRLADGTASGLEIRPFSVPGKVPLYMEDGLDDAVVARDHGSTFGLEVRSGGDRFIYAANCAGLPAELAERLKGAPLVFFDATLFSDDEMIRQGVGRKTGRRMGHMSLSGREGSLVRLRQLDIGRVILIHINNTNPILLRDSAERREVEAAGFEVAYDGMEITL